MIEREDELAALMTLLRLRPDGASWPSIAAEVAADGSALPMLSRVRSSTLVSPEIDDTESAVTDQIRVWRRDGHRLVTVLDEDYPARLRDIREAPPFLFAAGSLLPDDTGMSVVGSRRAPRAALEQAAAIAELLVDEELTVISGLAEGIDTAAHRSTLLAGGRTVAFLGTGISRQYPSSNGDLHSEIAQKGLLLSQFYPDSPPTRSSFPMRNALMSGYGLATIVVHAGETSGARIQARLAGEHGRPVILTRSVVEGTKWGSRMAGAPNVHVVRSLSEVRDAVRRVCDAPARLRRALAVLGAQ